MNARLLGALAAVAFAAQCAAFQASVAASRRPIAPGLRPTGSATHLYVAMCATASDCISGTISRYPLTHGVPAKNPDLTFPSDNGPITIAPNGDLYANYPGISSGLQAAVDVFAAGTNTLLRRLVLPGGSFYTAEVAIAVDANGYLYASWYNYPARMGPAGQSPSTNGALLVYAPEAKGNDQPINSLAGNYSGLAVDAHGTLYAAKGTPDGREVDVFDAPETSLIVSRQLDSRWIPQPQGIALDNSGVLHVLEESSKLQQYVASFNAAGNGLVRPLGIFRTGQTYSTYSGIWVADGLLYFPANATSSVIGFPASPHGGDPLFTLSTPQAPQFVAVGP